MKALSLRQPWCWAVLHAGKRVENRVWRTSYRGPFLLHAAVGCTPSEYLAATTWMASRALVRVPHFRFNAMEEIIARTAGIDLDTLPLVPPLAELPRGGIVGRASIVDVLAPSTDGKPRRPWHMPDQYGFILEEVAGLPFRPLKGLQLFFDPENPKRQIERSE